MPAGVLGLHHVTAIATEPQANLDFYCGVLGLRLVKRTVNFDDPGSYHLYYGDAAGRPGTLLTFFAWPGAPRGGRAGAGQAVACAFSVPRDSLPEWRARLDRLGIAHASAPERLGDDVLTLEDPDGMRVELVAADPPGAGDAISALHSVTLAVTEPSATAQLLTEELELHAAGASGERFRFEAGETGRARAVDLARASAHGRMGPGAIHHVAFRLADDEQQREWHEHLVAKSLGVSPVMDRCYFHSIYFREPGGVLFELATDGPGFATDEPLASLGGALCLPPWLESDRAHIERALPPITVPARREA